MNEQVLAALARYGEPALFAVVTVAAIGIPLPVMLLLIVTGSLAAQGAMDMGLAITVSSVGSVLGDQIGYAIGRWGGHAINARLSRLLGSEERLRQLDEKARAWGAGGVFFSRWLVAPLGPFVNLASGAAGYSWLRFTLWDVLGETLGCALYIGLGFVFSDRVQAVGAILGDLTWTIVAVIAAVILGWQLFFRKSARQART
jgi:membrane-associated protein